MIGSHSSLEIYRELLARHLRMSAGNIALFWKGRVALHAALRALGVGPGDEVVLPAFTCVAVPNAILYCGARPVYADIDESTYTSEAPQIAGRISPRTKVVIAQNSFGLSSDLDPILELAAAHGARVIEDCAHGFGGTYRGRPNGTTADVSIFSSQWSKPFSTGIGGFSAASDPQLAEALRQAEAALLRPRLREAALLRALLFARRRVADPIGYWRAVRLYRVLSRHNVVVGSSSAHELTQVLMPADFTKALSEVQAKAGIGAISRTPASIKHQRRIASLYEQALAPVIEAPPVEPAYATHTFLRYPLLVEDRDRLMADAMRKGLEVGDWFVSPVHPLVAGVEAWGYEWGTNPVAERTCRSIVNLPTHTGVDERRAESMVELVKSHARLHARRAA